MGAPNTSKAFSGWVMQAPVISTGHLQKSTIDELSGNVPGSENAYELFAIDTKNGAMVFCSDVESLDGLPEDLRACLQWNIEQGYEWLRFDADGDNIDGLPTYDW